MAAVKKAAKPRKRGAGAGKRSRPIVGREVEAEQTGVARAATALVEEARRAGLLDGDRAEHLSFRAPTALVEAAKRETGIRSPTELGIAALAALAQPDPVAAFMRRTGGRLAGLPPIEP